MVLVGLIGLALIIAGSRYARRKYKEWKEKKEIEEKVAAINEEESPHTEMKLANVMCNICDGMKSQVVLSCKHAFHEKCMARFVVRLGNECPVCAQPIDWLHLIKFYNSHLS